MGYKCIVCKEELEAMVERPIMDTWYYCDQHDCAMYMQNIAPCVAKALDEKRRELENIKQVHSRTIETIESKTRVMKSYKAERDEARQLARKYKRLYDVMCQFGKYPDAEMPDRNWRVR